MRRLRIRVERFPRFGEDNREPAQAGEAVVLRDGAMAWVASPEGDLHASIMRPGRLATI